MEKEERVEQKLYESRCARHYRVGRVVLCRFLCMCAFVCIVAGSALTAGAVTVFAAEDSTEEYAADGGEQQGIVEESDSPAKGCTGDIDLADIYEIGGYAEVAEEGDVASIASSGNFKYHNRVANSIKSFKKNIDVHGMGVTTSNVKSIFVNILALHPEIAYVANASYVYNRYNGSVSTLVISYIPNAKKVRESLVAAVKEVNKQVDTKNMKPAEIVLAYHEYLTSTVEYDASGIKDYSTVYGRDHKYDMYGTLVDKKAVCQGYAETMNYLLKQSGVPCALATSQYINHAWNVVRINGKWYHVDATWDDPVTDLPGQSRHDYFLISTDTLNRRTKNASSSYSLGRYDTKISAAWTGSYNGATDKKYESGQMWSGVEKVMYHRKGYWYCIKQGSSWMDFQIIKNRFSTGGKKVILSGTSVWYKTDGSYYTKQYGSIFLAQESLYFHTARYIGRIDLDSPKNEYTLLYDIRSKYSDGVNIYAMGWHNKQIVVWVSNTPLCNPRDAYLLAPCLKHSWNSGKVTKKATYTSTGTKLYTCKKCSYKKSVATPKLQLGKPVVKTAATVKGIRLSWNKVSGATAYKVYKKTKSGKYQLLKKANTLSIVDGRISSGKTYGYKIVACNAYTTSKVTTVSRLYLGNVKARAKNTNKGVKIAWNKVAGADSYRMYRKSGNSAYKLMKIAGSGAASWVDSKSVAGKKYTYAVVPYKKQTGGAYTPVTVSCKR